MIPNIHQSIEEIVKAAAPEEKVLWQQLRLLTGENAAIRQLYFKGPIAGTEFLTYSANKIYIAYDVEFSCLIAASATTAYVTLFNEANAANFYLVDMSLVWNATAAAIWYLPYTTKNKNCYFSRVTVNVYTHIKFNGYRIVF